MRRRQSNFVVSLCADMTAAIGVRLLPSASRDAVVRPVPRCDRRDLTRQELVRLSRNRLRGDQDSNHHGLLRFPTSDSVGNAHTYCLLAESLTSSAHDISEAAEEATTQCREDASRRLSG